MTKEIKNIELLNEIRDYLAVNYGLETYTSADDRVAYAVLVVYNAYVDDDNCYRVAIDMINDILKAIPYKISYSALERSLYRTFKRMYDTEYTNVLASCLKLAKAFKAFKEGL